MHGNYSRCVNLSVSFSSPDNLWKAAVVANTSQPLFLESFDSVIIMWRCFVWVFSFCFICFRQCLHRWLHHGQERVKEQAKSAPWSDMYWLGRCIFPRVLCCNQREWLSDCDFHHHRLMANQTGGLTTLNGFLKLSCTLSFSPVYIFRRPNQHNWRACHFLNGILSFNAYILCDTLMSSKCESDLKLFSFVPKISDFLHVVIFTLCCGKRATFARSLCLSAFVKSHSSRVKVQRLCDPQIFWNVTSHQFSGAFGGGFVW